MSRRRFLALAFGAGVVATASACTPAPRAVTSSASRSAVGPVGQQITLRARATEIDLGGRSVSAWTYGQEVPGPAIRARPGERVRITVHNDLPEETSVHWHGLAVPNHMDGVPGVTTAAVQPGDLFTYDFVVPAAGTHWFHPHTGLQLDTGLYAPFIVDDPGEPGRYDHEWILVLDDWTQGVGPEPQQIFDELVAAGGNGRPGGMMHGSGGMGHGNMGHGGGDVFYPLYLINGRPPADPDTLKVRRGERVRLRMINAAADTLFTVAVGGHPMTITHTDGYPVEPVEAQSVVLGMGERYDVLVDVREGVFPVVAEPVGKTGSALAVLRSGSGTLPAIPKPSELSAPAATADVLHSVPDARLPAIAPESSFHLTFSGSMAPYTWTINGATYEQAKPLEVQPGRAVRLRLSNMSMMSHPVHLHGHTFQIGPAGGTGARKDTLLLPPMSRADVDLLTDNPGRWMLHCHNAYHAEAGMMTRLDYIT